MLSGRGVAVDAVGKFGVKTPDDVDVDLDVACFNKTLGFGGCWRERLDIGLRLANACSMPSSSRCLARGEVVGFSGLVSWAWETCEAGVLVLVVCGVKP